jgi:hypothetical protein
MRSSRREDKDSRRPDWLGFRDLLRLDIDPSSAKQLLSRSPWTGVGGRPVIPADQLADLLGILKLEERFHDDRRP